VYVSTVVHGTVDTELNAVSVATKAVRTLDASPSILALARAAAGERIYIGAYLRAAGDDSNVQISRVQPTSGAVEILATRSCCVENLLISDDERFLVLDRILYDLQTGARTDLPPGRAVGFSPDGTQLLYDLDQVTVSTRLATLISTADGSSQTLHSSGYFIRAHRWQGNSPQLLQMDFDFTGGISSTVRVSEIDGVTGVTREIAQFPETPGTIGLRDARWSPDGQALAIWVRQDWKDKKTDRTNLYVVRPPGAPTLVASATPGLGGAALGPPVFSPTGNSIAYFYYHPDDLRSLYLKSGI
jgi:hypothetical protein